MLRVLSVTLAARFHLPVRCGKLESGLTIFPMQSLETHAGHSGGWFRRKATHPGKIREANGFVFSRTDSGFSIRYNRGVFSRSVHEMPRLQND